MDQLYIKRGNKMKSIESIVKYIISEYYTYLSQAERDSTEIEKKIAILEAESYELEAQTELAERYFSQNMNERERLFQSASQVLDKAMEIGDTEYARIAVRVIEIINQKSPFSF